MSRNVAVGMLIGMAVGMILYFVFPTLLLSEFTYSVSTRKALHIPLDYFSPKGGSIFAVGTLIPFLIALIGGGIGAIYYLIRHKLLK